MKKMLLIISFVLLILYVCTACSSNSQRNDSEKNSMTMQVIDSNKQSNDDEQSNEDEQSSDEKDLSAKERMILEIAALEQDPTEDQLFEILSKYGATSEDRLFLTLKEEVEEFKLSSGGILALETDRGEWAESGFIPSEILALGTNPEQTVHCMCKGAGSDKDKVVCMLCNGDGIIEHSQIYKDYVLAFQQKVVESDTEPAASISSDGFEQELSVDEESSEEKISSAVLAEIEALGPMPDELITCPGCKGTGTLDGKKCWICKGEGIVGPSQAYVDYQDSVWAIKKKYWGSDTVSI